MKIIEKGLYGDDTWEALDNLGMLSETGQLVVEDGRTVEMIEILPPTPQLVKTFPTALTLLQDFGWVIGD